GAVRRSLFTLVLVVSPAAYAGDVSVKLDMGAGFSVKNSTGAAERLRVDEATGNISRNGSLFVHTTGPSNLFIGQGAGNPAILAGAGNTGVGRGVRGADTFGYSNTGLGSFALSSNTGGFANTAIGRLALSY